MTPRPSPTPRTMRTRAEIEAMLIMVDKKQANSKDEMRQLLFSIVGGVLAWTLGDKADIEWRIETLGETNGEGR